LIRKAFSHFNHQSHQPAMRIDVAPGVHSGYCGAARFATSFAAARHCTANAYLGPLVGQQVRDAWRSGLRENGWIEGKNLIVE
jgi:hypothetical protein